MNNSVIKTFTGHTNWVQSANFSPDGKQIVSASREICILHSEPYMYAQQKFADNCPLNPKACFGI
jgi:WD40 repeat protein